MSAPLFLGDYWIITLRCVVTEHGRVDASCKMWAGRRYNNNSRFSIRIELLNDRG